MVIHFNTEWDGGPWADPGQHASLGTLKTGPLGLLTVLESRCGTTGTRISHAARVAAMMAALSTHSPDFSDQWFRSSFASDPWATAAELLSCRDQLLTARIAAGRPDLPASDQPLLPRRLRTLTALTDNPDIPGDGLPDRILDMVRELRSAEFCKLKPLDGYRIVVDEPKSLIPPVWRTVFDALPAAGGVVEYRNDAASTNSATPAAQPAPTLTVVTATDEWQAAEHLASFLSQLEQTDPAAARQLALVISGDAGALDLTLRRWGLPVTGQSGQSAARWGLQILPAFLATLWSPADPHAIASFLSLAVGLVPAVVSRQIIYALSEHPGTGGPKWKEALEKIADATDAETADRYDRFFARELSSPEEGVPASLLEERLTWLHRRLAAKADTRHTVGAAIGHIMELQDIQRRLSSDRDYRIPRALLERIMGTVVHPVSAGAEEQAALWSVHRSFACVQPSAGTVIYWNCTDDQPSVAHPFTDAERELLQRRGYLLESPETVRSRTEWNRRRSLSVPDRHIVALVPQHVRGAATEQAPWLTELKLALGDSVQKIDLSTDQSAIEIAGVPIARHEAAPLVPQDPAPTHHVPPGAIGYPDTLSYSAIHSLIGCPMQWTLGRIGSLSAASNVALPTGNKMMGTMTHAIIEQIAVNHAPGGIFPENCGQIAATLYDHMVPAMAAELLQPGRGLARQRYREIVVSAVTALREVIDRLGLTIRQVETFLKVPWELSLRPDGTMTTVLFRGPADMELADNDDNPFVLDLKYSYAENYYTDLVSTGKALQLASYAWLIEGYTGRKTIGSGYFLLPKRKLITDSPRAGNDAVASDRTLEEIWRRGEHSTTRVLRRLHTDGVVDVTALQEAEPETQEETDGLYVEPPCKFCDYSVICGFRRGQV